MKRFLSLTWKFAKIEYIGKYKNNIAGPMWVIIIPLVQFLVYFFVFGVVFNQRGGAESTSGTLGEYALYLFVGQTVFQLFAEPVGRASGLIVQVPNYVKKVIFPIEVFPTTSVIVSIFNFIPCLFIALLAHFFLIGQFEVSIILLPLTLIPIAVFALGLSFVVSSLGVYIKDLGNMVNIFLQLLFFTAPIFYKIHSVPEGYRWIVYLNPISHLIDSTRSCFDTVSPDFFYVWVGHLLVSFLFLIFGIYWFRKTKLGFGDVL